MYLTGQLEIWSHEKNVLCKNDNEMARYQFTFFGKIKAPPKTLKLIQLSCMDNLRKRMDVNTVCAHFLSSANSTNKQYFSVQHWTHLVSNIFLAFSLDLMIKKKMGISRKIGLVLSAETRVPKQQNNTAEKWQCLIVGEGEFRPCLNSISSATKSEPSDKDTSLKAIQVN